MKKFLTLLLLGAMLQLTAFSQPATDTAKGWYRNEYVRLLARDALMGDVYKQEFKRSDSLAFLYSKLVQNRDSIIASYETKDAIQTARVNNLTAQTANLEKQAQFNDAWLKALDKEFHKQKVKGFFHTVGLTAVIGGLTYLLLKP